MEEAAKRVHSRIGKRTGEGGDPEGVPEYDFFVTQSGPGEEPPAVASRPSLAGRKRGVPKPAEKRAAD